jgi:hypothetical protein
MYAAVCVNVDRVFGADLVTTRGPAWTPAPAPLLVGEFVGGFVALLDSLLEPVLYLLLNPADPAAWTIPQAHALWKATRVFETLDMLGAVEHQPPKFRLAD